MLVAIRAPADPSPAYLVKDINAQAIPGAGFAYHDLAVAGDIAYFAADTFESGVELWKTDGTAAGTALVKDIVPGNEDGLYVIGEPIADGTLFFVGRDGSELWRTDGSSAGTVP